MPAFLIILLSLGSCEAGTVLLKPAEDSGEGEEGDTPADDDSRLSALEDRMDQVEADLAECQDTVAGQAEQLAELEATVADQAEQLAELEATVADLEVGGAVGDFDALSQSTYSAGTSSSWSSLTSRALTLSAGADDVVVAFCSFTHGTSSGASYRVTIANDAGTYSDDAEVVGDSAYAGLTYGGENITVWGFWTVPADDTYEVTCQGKNGAGYDITFAAWTR